MRLINVLTIVLILLVLATTTASVLFMFATQPQAHAQLHNAYWPFTVETSIRDI